MKQQKNYPVLLSQQGIMRSKDLVAEGISRSELTRRVRSGMLIRVSRGLYALPDYQGSQFVSLATVARKSPHLVFCLLTALRFHDLTTQSPSSVWIAIDNKSHPPKTDYPPLHTVRFSPESLDVGVEIHTVDGVAIRVTSVEKTVADCFKFRNKIGMDIALEALRDAHGQRKCDMNILWHYARIDRVAEVMRPYLESVA
jgi:predicted transcriptional regulator of viral defense system